MVVTQTQALSDHTMQARKKCCRQECNKRANAVERRKRENTNTSACKYCGRSHAPRQCSAFDKFCRKCGGSNNFASVCLNGRSSARSPASSRRPVYTVESGETCGLFIGVVNVGEIDRSGWHANQFVGQQEVCFKLDSGAEAVLQPDTYQR